MTSAVFNKETVPITYDVPKSPRVHVPKRNEKHADSSTPGRISATPSVIISEMGNIAMAVSIEGRHLYRLMSEQLEYYNRNRRLVHLP